MKILHVVNIHFVLPYFIGDQFLYFKDKGYEIHVICSPSSSLKDYSTTMGFRYKEIPILRSFSVKQDIKSLVEICKYIKNNDIDIVVGHTPKGALLAMTASKIMNISKRIYFRHGLVYETSKGLKRRILLTAEKLTSFFATKIVNVSPSVAQQSIVDRLNSKNKQLVLGKGTCGGIDSLKKFNPEKINQNKLNALKEQFNFSDEDIIIGFCGRLVRDKGIIELVSVLEKLPTHYKLLLVGDYEERDSLPPLTKKQILNNEQIFVTGFISDDIEYYYSLMNIFVLPSYREGFPTSVLEASSLEIPVLTTTATGCIDSIIEGKTGFFINHSADSIITSITKLESSCTRKTMGKAGREFVVNNFDNRLLYPIIEKELYN